MQTNISKWGNSLALRLPKHVAESANLREGSSVEIEVRDSKLVITPSRPRYNLRDLLKEMEPGHRHAEIDWGEAKGKETW